MKPHEESRKTERREAFGRKMRHSSYWSILRLIQGRFIGDSAADGTPLQAIDAQSQALPADGGAQKSWASKFLSARVFDSVYWSWNRQSVATGAAWGAAAAIAPLPMQSLWGVFACLWRKGNIPVAILMAWLSPPGFTFLPFPLNGGWGGSFFRFWGSLRPARTGRC